MVNIISKNKSRLYTLWISRCISAARERIPGSIGNDVTGSQQRSNLKDNEYRKISLITDIIHTMRSIGIEESLFLLFR
ncbi:hypothetical protein [Photorhabdus laumondii]|uniref:hypothetical protein n=1 Tax=Photorhabdus laumondii TaxID=2218628 RepID=UPI003314B1F2